MTEVSEGLQPARNDRWRGGEEYSKRAGRGSAHYSYANPAWNEAQEQPSKQCEWSREVCSSPSLERQPRHCIASKGGPQEGEHMPTHTGHICHVDSHISPVMRQAAKSDALVSVCVCVRIGVKTFY